MTNQATVAHQAERQAYAHLTAVKADPKATRAERKAAFRAWVATL